MKSMITPKETVAPSEAHIEQQTLLTSIVLHLFPSLGVLIGSLIAAPLVVQAGFPVELAILLSSLLVGVSFRLGYLFYQGKKHNGTFSLRGIVLYWGHMPWWQYLLICLPLLLYALSVDVLLQPVSRALITHVFWWLPMALLPSTAALKLTAATLITGLVLLFTDGLIAPFVEELYYRGYLLPRLSRLGWFAPVLNSLLFTLGHFWQPYNYPLIFLLVLPEVCLVYWKRNIKISILVHCTANTFAAVLSLVLLLQAR
jgi:membrane protease YdiL (CAAX protease family)